MRVTLGAQRLTWLGAFMWLFVLSLQAIAAEDAQSTRATASETQDASHTAPANITLLQALEAHNEDAILASLAALGPDAQAALVKALEHRDPRVRMTAASILLSEKAAHPNIKKRVVTALIPALKDPDATLRHQAAKKLIQISSVPKEAIPVLIELLDDDEVHERAAAALTTFGAAAVPALIQVLRDGPASLRPRAILVLGDLGLPAQDAIPSLIEMLKDTGTYDVAITTLGKIGPAAVDPLIRALKDEDVAVRAGAAQALAALGRPAKKATPALIQALKDKGAMVRINAGMALGRISPTQALPALTQALADPDPDIRASAAVALGELGPAAQHAVPMLIKVLKDSDKRVRGYAAQALAQIGPASPEALAALIEALRDQDADVRASAAWAFHITPPADSETQAIRSALIQALQDNNAEVRVLAANALGKRGAAAREAIPALASLLNDGDTNVRRHAGLALTMIGLSPEWDELVPALRQAVMNGKDLYVRLYAVQALAQLSPAAQEAATVLTQVLNNVNEDRVLRYSAAMALGHIGPVAIPGLLEALDEQDAYVRAGAAQALREIGTPEALAALSRSKGF